MELYFLNAEWGNQNTFNLESVYILHKRYTKYPSTYCAKFLQKYSLKSQRNENIIRVATPDKKICSTLKKKIILK